MNRKEIVLKNVFIRELSAHINGKDYVYQIKVSDPDSIGAVEITINSREVERVGVGSIAVYKGKSKEICSFWLPSDISTTMASLIFEMLGPRHQNCHAGNISEADEDIFDTEVEDNIGRAYECRYDCRAGRLEAAQ